MTPEQLAARVLADVDRIYPWAKHQPMMLEEDALAAIARHLAPGDDLVERANAALDALRFSCLVSAPGHSAATVSDTITALLARIAALTATVAKIEMDFTAISAIADSFKSDCQAAEAEAARLRAMLTPPDDLRAYTVDYISGGADHGLPGDMPLVPADVVVTLRYRLARLEGALTNLPAVYAHQINTGVREVYDPLQRFYTMESVLIAIADAQK